MEEIRLYSVYDNKGERYDTPFFAKSDLFAKRRFIMTVEDDGSLVNRFKNDFKLVMVGIFNVLSGTLEPKNEVIIEGIQINLDVKNENGGVN